MPKAVVVPKRGSRMLESGGKGLGCNCPIWEIVVCFGMFARIGRLEEELKEECSDSAHIGRFCPEWNVCQRKDTNKNALYCSNIQFKTMSKVVSFFILMSNGIKICFDINW